MATEYDEKLVRVLWNCEVFALPDISSQRVNNSAAATKMEEAKKKMVFFPAPPQPTFNSILCQEREMRDKTSEYDKNLVRAFMSLAGPL